MRTGVYVRVSTQRQAQAQTIDQQLERLRDHLGSQGVVLASEAVFRDDGYSGATLNRPGLDRLRDAARAGEVEHVLVTDPDRLARNYVQPMVLLEELERSGCRATFLDRPMPGPAGPTAAADPRRGGRVRAHAHRRAHAPGSASAADSDEVSQRFRPKPAT